MSKSDPKGETLRKESLPYNYRIDEQFPSKRMVKAIEGGGWFAAEKDGRFYLICDEGTMADFILPDDEDLLDKMLTVLEFESENEREQYLRRRTRQKTKRGSPDDPKLGKSFSNLKLKTKTDKQR